MVASKLQSKKNNKPLFFLRACPYIMDTTSLQMLHLCVKRTWKFAQHELTACIIYCKCNTERNYSLQIWFLKSLNYSSMTELQSIGDTVATKKAEAIFLHWKFDSLKHIIARENGGRTKFQKKLFSNLTKSVIVVHVQPILDQPEYTIPPCSTSFASKAKIYMVLEYVINGRELFEKIVMILLLMLSVY